MGDVLWRNVESFRPPRCLCAFSNSKRSSIDQLALWTASKYISSSTPRYKAAEPPHSDLFAQVAEFQSRSGNRRAQSPYSNSTDTTCCHRQDAKTHASRSDLRIMAEAVSGKDAGPKLKMGGCC